nr:neural-cadherin-like [Leptinotarsa decemlineata]
MNLMSTKMKSTNLFVAFLAFLSTATSKTISVIPHDAHPGYSVKKFNHAENLKLLDSDFSQFFTMLQDGSIMTVSDVSPLVNHPVDLVVLENKGNLTTTHMLKLYVLDRRNMLSFKTDGGEDIVGRVTENSPAGTRLSDIPLIQAASDLISVPVTYSIIAGNSAQYFELQDSITGEVLPNVTISDRNGGVSIVTSQVLDREETSRYVLTIQAVDPSGINRAVTNVVIEVEDENDNSPVFTQKVYRFVVGDDSIEGDNVTMTWKRFSSIGKVEATDADGDKVAYKLATPTNFLVIVPQTGDLLLAQEPTEETELELIVEAHDLRTPSRTSPRPAQVIFHFKPLESSKVEMDLDFQQLEEVELTRRKRRVTRAVRPTKRIEFTETDGETDGRVVFQLEKETDRETFKIRDENPWVTVDPNGSVRVKKKWDYEELGPEKTIDFWVTITNAEKGGRLLGSVLDTERGDHNSVTESEPMHEIFFNNIEDLSLSKRLTAFFRPSRLKSETQRFIMANRQSLEIMVRYVSSELTSRDHQLYTSEYIRKAAKLSELICIYFIKFSKWRRAVENANLRGSWENGTCFLSVSPHLESHRKYI